MHIFADTARLAEIERLDGHPWITGFTTNPTLFKQAKVQNPRAHAEHIMKLTSKLVSFDGPPEMVWDLGPNAVAKVDTYSLALIDDEDRRGRINLTAVCHAAQVQGRLYPDDIVSVFAGRIMDTGRDPAPIIAQVRRTIDMYAQVLWASCRELYHLRLAEEAGCDIITMQPSLIDKLDIWWGMPLEACAGLTVKQFLDDAVVWE